MIIVVLGTSKFVQTSILSRNSWARFSVGMEELVPVKALDVGHTILESKKKLLGMALGTEKWP